MFCKRWLTFARKGHVGLVQNRAGVISEQEQSLQNQYYSYWTYLGMAIYNSIYIERLYIPACANLRQRQGFRNFFMIFARVSWQEACFETDSRPEIEIIPWYLIFSKLSALALLYYRPQIKSIHVFKRIILVKLVLLWKWKCKSRKLLSSHALLPSFLLRSNRTTLQAQIYRVFNHANWPIKTRHSHWLCSNK